MKESKIVLLNNIFFTIVLFIVFFLSIFNFSYANITDGYLSYCGDGSEKPSWVNYPEHPGAGQSYSCLSKRYCSDIKFKGIKIGEFDREEGTNELKLNSTILEETSSKCSKTDEGKEISKIEIKDDFNQKAFQTTIKKTVNEKCQTIQTAPIKFLGLDDVDLDGNHTKVDKSSILYSPNAENCYLKSCLDLNVDELSAIYGVRFSQDKVPQFKNFCLPYKYKGSLNFGNGDLKYFVNTGQNTGISMKDIINNNIFFNDNSDQASINKTVPDNNIISCHEFTDSTKFKYLIIEGDAFNNSGQTIKNIFQCRLHQCPNQGSESLSCPTNYYLFYEKDNKGQLIRNQNYIQAYEEYVLKNTNLDNPRRSVSCSKISCLDSRLTDSISCDINSSLPKDCDIYEGVDRNLQNINLSIYNQVKNTYDKTQSCASNGYCLKTTDCGLYKTNIPEVCQLKLDPNNREDRSLSYFYRPLPSTSATELLSIKNLSTESEEYVPSIINYSVSNGLFHNGVTVIKRILKGVPDDISKKGRTNGRCLLYQGGYKYDNREGIIRSQGKNYFRNFSNTDRDNVCASQDEFKKFGYFEENYPFWFFKCFDIWYGMGDFYNGYGHYTRLGTLPHILPLCDVPSLGVKGGGRAYTCDNRGYICNKPSWDSYYFRGEPEIVWNAKKPNVKKISATLCLRMKNTGELGVCGNRECRVDCAFGLCKLQWCGIDRCVDLSLDESEDCTLQNIREGKISGNSRCFAEVTSGVRFRINKIGRKIYGFLDTKTTACTLQGFGEYMGDMDSRRKGSGYDFGNNMVQGVSISDGDKSSFGGTFRGIMDENDLVDDNSLTDNNNDGVINDADVFGEHLYWIWKCNDSKNKDPRCSKFSARNGNNGSISDLSPDWVTWDIVQYIGNNQPQAKVSNGSVIGNTNCTVNNLVQCRGFYDKNNIFHREQQNVVLPLPTPPDLFYKYATIDNTPDLFLPLLFVYSFDDTFGNEKVLINSNDDDILLDFFTPRLTIDYSGNITVRRPISLNFEEIETTSKSPGGNIITTKFNDIEISTGFKLKKISTLYPEPEASVCLSQLLTNNVEQQIKCLRRDNPKKTNFIIKPNAINVKEPTFYAYFHKDSFENLKSGDKITNLDDLTKFIPFFNNPSMLNSEEYRKLKGNLFIYAQNYPLYLENSYCSNLNYSCVLNQKSFILEKEKGALANQEIISNLESKISNCENQIEIYCNINSGNDSILQKTTKDKNGNFSQYLIKFKENYNVDGVYNQACIVKGFEKYSSYVYASPSTGTYLGKCELNLESKKNSKCRRNEYYRFCKEKGKDGCECLDGTNACDCSISGNCIKTIDCSVCPNNDCSKLDKECFLPGFNGENILLNNNNTIADACICEYAESGELKNINGLEVRKATPRESGLCVPLRDIKFCNAVKYYNESKIYNDGGEGKILSSIKNSYISNIWRTQQKQYGKYYFGNLGHAEFDKSNDCTGLDDDFCLLRNKCYNEETGEACKDPGKDCSKPSNNCSTSQKKCVCGLLQPGVCKGFWKQKTDNTVPLANCKTEKVGDAEYTLFKLIENTACERYSCPIIDINNVVLSSELDKKDLSEINSLTSNNRGLFHGFATWDSYKKGSYNTPDGAEENAYGDDIEERSANNCIQGYGPAGLNYILYNYIPVVNEADLTTTLSKEDLLIKEMIGYNNPSKDDPTFKDYVLKTAYNAREHLPVRYCNQVGEWMPTSDLYSKFKFDLYNKTNADFHTNLDLKGLMQNVNKYNTNIKVIDKNTYGNSINYGKKYCERLFCREFNKNSIGLLSIEASEPSSSSGKDFIKNKYYPNEPGNLNYPKDPTNKLDTRINNVVNNKYTTWRHIGGATWSETPATRDLNKKSVIVTGICQEDKNFYPFDTKFISTDVEDSNKNKVNMPSFQAQFDTLFPVNLTNTEVNLKNNSLKDSASPAIQPTRVCSKWGVWGEIQDKCITTCEPLDVFRTCFEDSNKDNKLENHEITKLFKTPRPREIGKGSCNNINPIGNIVDGLKYGDVFTGGAKWARIKAGTVALGECDATAGKGTLGFPSDGIQFLRSGKTKVKVTISDIPNYNGTFRSETIDTNGRPYRVCQLDGTWGPIKDPCIQFLTCKDTSINTKDLIGLTGNSGNFQTLNGTQIIKTIATLNGGSFNYSDAQPTDGSAPITKLPISMNCSSNPAFISGTISRTCDITKGEWTTATNATCQLKTCPAKTIKIGNNTLLNVPANKYYLKSSGYSGQVTLKAGSTTNTYTGYEYTSSCPTGYYCQNCEDNGNKYTYNCDSDSDGQPAWKIGTNKAGLEQRCVPITCNSNDLKTKCNGVNGCTFTTTVKTTTGNGGLLTQNNVVFENGGRVDGLSYTNGTFVELGCSTGYYENKTVAGGDVYGECKINPDGKTASWNIVGSCIMACDKLELADNKTNNNSANNNRIITTAPGILGSIFYPDYNNATINGDKYENRYLVIGSSVDANCQSAYAEISTGGQINSTWGTHAYKCVNSASKGEWKRMGGCRKKYNCSTAGISYTFKICTNSGDSDCYYNYDPSGACNLRQNKGTCTGTPGSYSIEHGKSGIYTQHCNFVLYAGAGGGGYDWSCADEKHNVNYKLSCDDGSLRLSRP